MAAQERAQAFCSVTVCSGYRVFLSLTSYLQSNKRPTNDVALHVHRQVGIGYFF